MFNGRSKGRSRGKHGTIQKVPLKGLFSDGVWRCSCDPRLPAQRLQTKNGGKYHGRWFYTCQKPQPLRCDFFLWDDEAKPREASAVLNNSCSEPLSVPQTPVKSFTVGFLTPQSSVKSRKHSKNPETQTPSTPSKTSSARRSFTQSILSIGSPLQPALEDEEDDEEFYDWPSSDDEELSKAVSQIPIASMAPPETPRKALKPSVFSTPGKRNHDEMAHNPSHPNTSWTTPASTKTLQSDDVFSTPTTIPRPANLFTPTHLPPSPGETPTTLRSTPIHHPIVDSDIAADILQLLHNAHVTVPADLVDGIRAIGHRHSMHVRGVFKGRDISRALVARKNEVIAELQGSIAALRAEKETYRDVVRYLRQELEEEREGM